MAVVKMDGMKHYTTTEMDEKYTSVSDRGISASPTTQWEITAEGRFGNCIKRTALNNGSPGYLVVSPFITQTAYWSPTTSGMVGFALKVDDLQAIEDSFGWTSGLLQVYLGADLHLRFTLDSNGTLGIYRYDGGSTLQFLTISGEGITDDTWYYLEFKWHIHDSTGYAEVRVNGITVARFDGDTASSPYPVPVAPLWNAVRILALQSKATSPYLTCRMCDLYVGDLSGSVNNDLLGDIVVDYIRPNGVGAASGWTPITGPSNYQDVDETTPDDDTTYVSTTVAGTRDLYEMEDVVGDPKAIQIVAYARRETEGSAQIKASVRSGGTTYDHLAQGVADTTYSYLTWPYDTNPDTGAPFTDAEMDAIQAGVLKSL